MTLSEMIYHRKSCRSFTNAAVDEATLAAIRTFPMKPLYPQIKVHWDIVPRNQVKCICPWATPQLIAVYSEEADGWQENAGFLFQQMDLYLQSLGLGVCWLGMGRMHPRNAPKVEGMQFVIMLAFGYPKGEALRHELKGFKRKTLEQIADRADPRLEPARLAPSAVNSQPWYFTHQEQTLHAYCSRFGHRLNMGIALAHLYVADPDNFRFFQAEDPPALPGYEYIGSL